MQKWKLKYKPRKSHFRAKEFTATLYFLFIKLNLLNAYHVHYVNSLCHLILTTTELGIIILNLQEVLKLTEATPINTQ